MKILAIAQVEDDKNVRQQIAKQTIQPNEVYILVDTDPAKGIAERRKRIAENHQVLMAHAKASECDFIWQLEGDVEIPQYALELLISDYNNLKSDKLSNIAYISGIQVGRHGLYCLGAWHVAEDKKSFRSADYKLQGIQKVDGTGYYCLFGQKSVWLSGKSFWAGEPWGPDVNWGLSLREKGYDIYIDMDLQVGHITQKGIIMPEHISTCNARFYLDKDGRWKYEVD